MATTTVSPTTETKKKKSILSGGGMALLSRLAKALMVPIAILPFAALINRVGVLMQTGFTAGSVTQYSFIWWTGRIMQIPGDVVFANLSLLFAIGIGFGLSEDFRGEAALAAAVAFLGLQTITGPDGLAQLFYSGTLTYDQSAIDSLLKPILDADGVSIIGLPVVNLADSAQGINILDNVNGEYVNNGNIMSYGSVSSFFEGKTQLLYFAGGWEIIPVVGDSSSTEVIGYVLLPTVNYMLDVGVIGGIVSGGVVAFLYNRYRAIKIPESLSFFGGRRFIPMLAIASVWGTGLVFAIIWPWCQMGLLAAGQAVASPANEAGRVFGFGVYAFFNRLVQPLGLHHIINTFLWFQFPISGPSYVDMMNAGGVYDPSMNQIVFGDINAFAAGILGSGIFQAGFFPLYMGGYVGIAAALTMAAPKENRKEVGIFFGSTAFVAFLTGIDEPILFSFMFVAPLLWIINCLLVPVFGMIVTAQHISLGFGFSAGLIDYVISLPAGWQMANFQFVDGVWQEASGMYSFFANPLWIFVWSAVMGVVYFPIFYFITVKMDIPTEGREKDAEGNFISTNKKSTARGAEKYEIMSDAVVKYVKPENIVEVTNCTTRLRLTVIDNKKDIDDAALKAAGFNGIIRVGDQALQLIVGTDVENVTEKLNDKLAEAGWTKPKTKKESKTTTAKKEE